MLSQINLKLIRALCKFLKIQTSISLSTDYSLPEDRNLRLIELCHQLKATHYLSGPAAKNYLDEKLFNDNGIQVIWMDYSGYPEYNQLYPPFEHGVSILDLVFNEGPNASNYMKSF